MSKFMRIYGNFEQFGEWSEPDPGFEGHIVVDDNGKFIGYQDELYGDVAGLEFLNNELNNVRFITGYIAENNLDGAEGIAYLKLSRDYQQAPLMYVVPNLQESTGSWAALGGFGMFEARGRAKVTIEEIGEDGEIIDRIHQLEDLYRNDDDEAADINNQLLDQVDTCLTVLQNVG